MFGGGGGEIMVRVDKYLQSVIPACTVVFQECTNIALASTTESDLFYQVVL